MKHIAVFDDNLLQYFRRDDIDGLTLVLNDITGCTRAVRLKPLIRPIFTCEDGESVYLTDGHVKAMRDYEEAQAIVAYAEHVNDFNLTSDTLERVGKRTLYAVAPEELKKFIGADCKTCERDKYCPHYLPVNAVRRYGCRWYVESGGDNEDSN